MSMRPLIYPLSDLEPIRQAVGSRDELLIDRMVDGYTKLYEVGPESSQAEEFRDRARFFVRGSIARRKGTGRVGWVHPPARS